MFGSYVIFRSFITITDRLSFTSMILHFNEIVTFSLSAQTAFFFCDWIIAIIPACN